MSGALINVTIEDREVKADFARIAAKVKDMTPFMGVVGETIRTSVIRNFVAGGRPDKWQISKRVQKKGGKTLIKSSELMGSVHYVAHMNGVDVGTNIVYAAAQHFGMNKSMMVKVKEHMRKVSSRDVFRGKKKIASGVGHVTDHDRMQKMNLPARPFLMIQEEDWPVIKEQAEHYLLKEN